tara:strand:- start:78 stop:596 length:519 start_codon:yes stop_codon:yes gene_type:complete
MSGTTDNFPAPSRPEMRAPQREEDPRARAARRAAEIRGHIGGDLDEGQDDFKAPRAPEGWTYEWKRRTVYGQEDPAYQVELKRMGWDEVPTSRHPDMMPFAGDHRFIERKGMVLMERPTELVEEARDVEKRRARQQVRAKEAQLSGSEADTPLGPRSRPDIKKGYEPLPVPD